MGSTSSLTYTRTNRNNNRRGNIMKAELTNLFNTLCQIETKGRNTIIMGDCLRYLEQLINKSTEIDKPVETEEESA